MRLLIVDDEQKIRELIGKYASFEGYDFLEAADGMEAVEKVRSFGIDLVILDIMMPELDGFSAAREIRRIREDIPIILLSARGEEYEKIYGFEIGVDDYVVKPFSPKELMLRVAAILRRSGNRKAGAEHEKVIIDDMMVDFTARQVIINGINIDLSPKEYELLFYMVRNRGIALTRDKLISEIWGFDFFGDDRTLDTHIKLLRKRLGEYSKYITTLRGVGYRFEKEK